MGDKLRAIATRGQQRSGNKLTRTAPAIHHDLTDTTDLSARLAAARCTGEGTDSRPRSLAPAA